MQSQIYNAYAHSFVSYKDQWKTIKHICTTWTSASLGFRGHTFPPADLWVLPPLRPALWLLFWWQTLQVAEHNQIEPEPVECVYSHGPAPLLNVRDGLDSEVSDKAREETPRPGEDKE